MKAADSGSRARPRARPRTSSVLVLSAPVGASHSAMARELAGAFERRGAPARVIDDFDVLGPRLARVLSRGFDYHLDRVGWSYDITYRLVMGVGAARRAGEAALEAFGGDALLATIDRARAAVVVSTYPVINAVLGRLRAKGRLSIPACGVVGPLAGLGFWVHPGLDLHLAMYEQALPEIERLAGPGCARAIRPLVDERYFEPRDRAAARRALDAGERVAVVSGGAWGTGDLESLTIAALAGGAESVLVVCGRNRRLCKRLETRFAGDARVRVLGFCDAMDDLLAAADVLISGTVGVSTFEARLRGCRIICAGWLVGHVRDNARALARHGLAEVATDPDEVRAAVARALALGPAPVPPLARLPNAADLVAAVVARTGAATGPFAAYRKGQDGAAKEQRMGAEADGGDRRQRRYTRRGALDA